MFATKREKVDFLIDMIGMVMDEHGIRCEDGHWMTSEELLALSDEEVVRLFNLCYNQNETLED